MNPSASILTKTKLDFQAPRPQDIQWAEPLLLAADRMGCEFCFGNIYAWSLRYGTEIARADGIFFSRSTSVKHGRRAYGMPLGETMSRPEALRGAVMRLKEDAARGGTRGGGLHFYGLEARDVRLLEDAFPGEFAFEPDRDSFDYIYAQSDLAALAGKKYHSKRNHIARFVKDNADWRYEEITPGNLEECLAMANRWEALYTDRDPEGLEQEARALCRACAHYEAFGMRGGLLRVGGELIAFTLGEPLSRNTFATHFEKAYPQIPGAYQMINRCFAEHTLKGFAYINREEDLGSDGLRKAKQSYHPAILLEKYKATEIL